MRIAQRLRGMQVLHVSSTFYGGGGLKQQIEYGVSGFPVGSMDEAAQRMAQLLENEALRKQIGAEGQKTCASVFSCRARSNSIWIFSTPSSQRFAVNHQRLKGRDHPIFRAGLKDSLSA